MINKKIYYTFISILICALLSVVLVVLINKNIHPVRYGRIRTFLNVFNNASVSLYDSYQLKISDMFFRDNLIIENVPDAEITRVKPYNLIYDGYYIEGDNLQSLSLGSLKNDLKAKNSGAIFVNDTIPNYENRINMSDTVLNNKNLKRFYIRTPLDFSVFYVDETLQNLPYSFNFIVDKDYNGTLVRIDTYQEQFDKFTTLFLTHTDTIPENIYNTLNIIFKNEKQK
ncbi:MAG: hypothetical protein Q4G63_12925 [Bacteroidia bacterium]|nr:hypothetical protein [Bacteroidia bacterium]